MTTIFPAAFIPVIVMGVVLEIGKISAVLFLHRSWKNAPLLIRSYLMISIFVLMFINSIGIFGFLSKAHIQQEVINNTEISQTVVIQSKLDNEQSIIKDINNQIVQIDNALTKLTDQGKAATSLAQGNAQRKIRDTLETQKNQHLKAVEDLTTQKVMVDNNNSKVTAEFGPLLYIADAFYGVATKEQLEATVRYIISILVFVFDPLALVLLVASQYAFQNRKKKLTGPNEGNTLKIENEVMNFWKE